MSGHLKVGNMKNYNPNSGQYIVYKDHSTSGIAGLSDQSTADPISLASLFRQPIIVATFMQVNPFEGALPIPGALMQEFASWEAASDEALINFERENL